MVSLFSYVYSILFFNDLKKLEEAHTKKVLSQASDVKRRKKWLPLGINVYLLEIYIFMHAYSPFKWWRHIYIKNICESIIEFCYSHGFFPINKS